MKELAYTFNDSLAGAVITYDDLLCIFKVEGKHAEKIADTFVSFCVMSGYKAIRSDGDPLSDSARKVVYRNGQPYTYVKIVGSRPFTIEDWPILPKTHVSSINDSRLADKFSENLYGFAEGWTRDNGIILRDCVSFSIAYDSDSILCCELIAVPYEGTKVKFFWTNRPSSPLAALTFEFRIFAKLVGVFYGADVANVPDQIIKFLNVGRDTIFV